MASVSVQEAILASGVAASRSSHGVINQCFMSGSLSLGSVSSVLTDISDESYCPKVATGSYETISLRGAFQQKRAKYPLSSLT